MSGTVRTAPGRAHGPHRHGPARTPPAHPGAGIDTDAAGRLGRLATDPRVRLPAPVRVLATVLPGGPGVSARSTTGAVEVIAAVFSGGRDPLEPDVLDAVATLVDDGTLGPGDLHGWRWWGLAGRARAAGVRTPRGPAPPWLPPGPGTGALWGIPCRTGRIPWHAHSPPLISRPWPVVTGHLSSARLCPDSARDPAVRAACALVTLVTGGWGPGRWDPGLAVDTLEELWSADPTLVAVTVAGPDHARRVTAALGGSPAGPVVRAALDAASGRGGPWGPLRAPDLVSDGTTVGPVPELAAGWVSRLRNPRGVGPVVGAVNAWAARHRLA